MKGTNENKNESLFKLTLLGLLVILYLGVFIDILNGEIDLLKTLGSVIIIIIFHFAQYRNKQSSKEATNE